MVLLIRSTERTSITAFKNFNKIRQGLIRTYAKFDEMRDDMKERIDIDAGYKTIYFEGVPRYEFKALMDTKAEIIFCDHTSQIIFFNLSKRDPHAQIESNLVNFKTFNVV